MRFKPTANNLIIDLGSENSVASVHAIVRSLVPRFTKKVYFLSDQPIDSACLIDGLSLVTDGQEPSNFVRSFRVIQRGNELTVVSSHDRRFSQEQWRALAEELSANAA